MDNTEKEIAVEDIAQSQVITAIPMVDLYKKNYSNMMSGNDQKAVDVFRLYETNEKLNRLKNELLWIKQNLVSEAVLNSVIGKQKIEKFQTYESWARFMLIWIAQTKK